MYSVKEAAKRIGISERHLRLLLERGEIKGKKLGHDWVVLELDYTRKRKPKGGKQHDWVVLELDYTRKRKPKGGKQ